MVRKKLCLGLMLMAVFVFFGGTAQAAEIWGVISAAGDPGPNPNSTTPTYLFKFTDNGSSFTQIGIVKLVTNNNNIDVDALAMDAGGNLLGYQMFWSGSAYTGSQLLSINKATGAATAIGTQLSGKQMRGAVFVGPNLWVTDANNNQLLKINPIDGAVISTTTLSGATIGNSTDLAVAPNGTVYLTNAGGPATFYTVNLTTGVLTQVYSISTGIQNVGLAFSASAPADRVFTLDVSGTDDIYYHNINSAWARATLFTDIITPASFNAGRGDLASYVPLPGALLLLGAGLVRLVAYGRQRQ